MEIYTNIINPQFLDVKKAKIFIDSYHNDEVFVCWPDNDKYFISCYGRCYSKYRNRLIKTYSNTNDENGEPHYKLVGSSGKPENYSVGRLVAKLFCKNDDPLNKTDVHHKDKNKQNNYYKNLEWLPRDEHKLKDSGRELFIYNYDEGSLKKFKTINKLKNYLKVDRKIIENAIYRGKPKYNLVDGSRIVEIKGVILNDKPLLLAIKDMPYGTSTRRYFESLTEDFIYKFFQIVIRESFEGSEEELNKYIVSQQINGF